jgi:glycosyltransferase involved in cell wall biosynthesis
MLVETGGLLRPGLSRAGLGHAGPRPIVFDVNTYNPAAMPHGEIEVVCEGDIGRTGAPLVTHWVQCYKHERWVGAAVRSVLAQTYTPLEVFISDDASPDRTWDVAAPIARAYRGPHRVVLYRGVRNVDSFAHINDVWPHIRGEFVVWQSGDDVAEPDYVAVMTDVWRHSGGGGAWCNHTILDESGRDLGTHLPDHRSASLNPLDFSEGRFLDVAYGGVLGFARDAFERFGPMPRHLATRGIEHQFALRAALSGGTSYIPRPLVHRRHHSGSLTDGVTAHDRSDDPLAVHSRRTTMRLRILTSLREALTRGDGSVSREYQDLSAALLRQTGVETRRWFALEAFRDRRAHAADPHAPEFAHSGVSCEPTSLTLIRKLPGALNLIAFECQYHAVPQAIRAIEPCGLRNGAYPGVVSAWSEVELLAALHGSQPRRTRC